MNELVTQSSLRVRERGRGELPASEGRSWRQVSSKGGLPGDFSKPESQGWGAEDRRSSRAALYLSQSQNPRAPCLICRHPRSVPRCCNQRLATIEGGWML